MEQARSQMLADADRLASSARLGLFSVPPPLFLGDDSPARRRLHPKDEAGKPTTAPRNITATCPRGTSHSDLFSFTPFASPGQPNPYQDPAPVRDSAPSARAVRHEQEFKPSYTYKTIASSPYHHIDEGQPPANPRRHRNSEGLVVLEKRNFTTNSHNKIADLYFT